MAATGKWRSLWWEFSRRYLRRNIKINGVKISRSLWWDREGWHDVEKVWIFCLNEDYCNINRYTTDSFFADILRLRDAYDQITVNVNEMISLGHDLKIVSMANPRFFFIGAKSDDWLVYYRLIFGESSIFDDNLSGVDTRV